MSLILFQIFFDMEKGYILLSRSLLDSDVFASQKLLKVWIWCLCKANFKDKTVPHFRGESESIVKLKRGQFLFGRFKAEDELGINGSTIYKSMKYLEKLKMIKIESSKRFSIVTVCKYDIYQDNKTYKVTTGEQQENNRVTTGEQQSNTTNTLNTLNTLKEDRVIIFNRWLNYRKEIKKPIKVESTIKTLISRFNSETIEKINFVVNHSIENSYQGLFWDKFKHVKTESRRVSL